MTLMMIIEMDILHHCSDVEMQTPEQTPELTPGSSGAYPLLQAYAIACTVSNMGLFGPKKVFAKKWAYFGIQRKVIIEKRAYQNFLA